MRATRNARVLAATVVVALLAAAVHFVLCQRYGRLAFDLHYDDVAYATEAADRLEDLAAGGLPGFAHALVAHPPHSPWMVLQAMVAFSVAGLRDEALYASNAWILVAAALAVVAILRGRPLAVVALGVAALVSSPLAFAIMSEFRPDLLLGLVTALLAWVLARKPSRHAVPIAGFLMGMALLVKPTFFAHTLAIAFAAGVAGMVVSRMPSALATDAPKWSARQLVLALLLGCAIAVPYAVIGGKQILGYFWANTYGENRNVWNYAAELPLAVVAEQSLPFLFKLGRFDGPATCAAALSFAFLLAGRRQRPEAWRVAQLLALAGLSAAIIVLGRQRSSYFFATMHWLLFFAALEGYAAFEATTPPASRWRPRTGFAVLLVALAIANGAMTFPLFPDYTRRGSSWNARIVALVQEDLRRHPVSDPQGPRILVASGGPVNRGSLLWVARGRGLRFVAPEMLMVADGVAAQAVARSSDYIVVPRPTIETDDAALPVREIQVPLLRQMRSDARFQPLSTLAPGDAFEVYANRQRD